MNSFQKSFTKETGLKILDVLFPNREIIKEWIRINFRYSHVLIDYKKISIGIEYLVAEDGINRIQSGDKPLVAFINAHNNSHYRVWKFVDCEDYKIIEFTEEQKSKVNEILDLECLRPTPKEMYNYYHRD